MQRLLHRQLNRLLLLPSSPSALRPSTTNNIAVAVAVAVRPFSTNDPPIIPGMGGWGDEDSSSYSSSSSSSSSASFPWSLGLSPDDYAGPAVGRPAEEEEGNDKEEEWEGELQKGMNRDRVFVEDWEQRYEETCGLMRQVMEPGARGSYLKDFDKAEIYRLHRLDPNEYSVDRLARDFRVMRQRVHAILWLKELEEKEEKRTGTKLDDSVERLLDECPEFFISHDKEFHVASLSYKPDFKVMPVDWDGTAKDSDEVLYEISMKEDEMLYQQFVQNMNFNKKKMAGDVYHHKYSRRRPSKGWNFTIEKLGMQDKCRSGNAFRIVSLPDGSSRELNNLEKLYARRERPRRRRKILP